jgi:cathepsin X
VLLCISACDSFPSASFNLYGADEYGVVRGEAAMMAEVFARGPIVCTINSHPAEFKHYKGGVITCDKLGLNADECRGTLTHLVVIAGWGVEEATGLPYWIGRNSYGTQWGEGAGGGWFRLERGRNTLQIESGVCAWAVPAAGDVRRVLEQFEESA